MSQKRCCLHLYVSGDEKLDDGSQNLPKSSSISPGHDGTIGERQRGRGVTGCESAASPSRVSCGGGGGLTFGVRTEEATHLELKL